MIEKEQSRPGYLFEVSWEVCNKVGGIYTVVSTKALTLTKIFDGQYFLIGPDVWMEIQDNPEFLEDKTLFRAWREKAEMEGLRFRIGRWNIEGSPQVLLVDFTPYFSGKDKIFADYWVKYQLDSITGQWDYIEPALFGYAAAQIIESYYKFYLSAQDRLIAHFHEWMTGTGVLYLKDNVPQAGTVFTTHATVMGRSIAGNFMPLYRDLSTYQPDQLANNLGIRAKYSLEKIAAQQADAFTTVSEITNPECIQFLGKKADVVTPNGFENSFVPGNGIFNEKRAGARQSLLKVAAAVLGYAPAEDSLLIINSGRYEFRNKGIDLFIDSMWKLNKDPGLQKEVIAFIMVPAHQTGPNPIVLKRLNNQKGSECQVSPYLTHDLFDTEHDPVLGRIRATGLQNLKEDKVKIIFVPAFLNGSDGIFDLHYYDLLIGFDLSVFPSYYEPWGYTPLESLAFRIPTITTSLTGFGAWIISKASRLDGAISVVNRNEDNAVEVVEKITTIISEFSNKKPGEIKNIRKLAGELSQTALWENLVSAYLDAFSVALSKVEERAHLFWSKQSIDYYTITGSEKTNLPVWKKIMVKPSLPPHLKDLQRLAANFWWCWNDEAYELFEMTDKVLWEESGFNPMKLIEMLSFDHIKMLSMNKDFIQKLSEVAAHFDNYMAQAVNKPSHTVAYFSMEYGLNDTLKIYSGGLGMLAGDYLKEASDSNVNIIGIGLLYRYGYFSQTISLYGDQISKMIPQQITQLPVQQVRNSKGEPIMVSMALPGRNIYAKVWKAEVGRIPLYLMDTDIEENQEVDRQVTHQLYGGDWENRFKQELLLGVGGIRLLDAIGAKPDIYHCNEGHAAFIGLERLRKYVQEEKLSFNQALEVVRSSSLFTTHTPVPAGHDAFVEDTLRTYIPHYADRLNISWDTFMNLGRGIENKPDEKFSMSVLAARLSQEINGVSRIHGRVSQKMFKYLYDGYFPEELHISYITNGVHMPTWTASAWKKLYLERIGPELFSDQSNPIHWKKIHEVSDELIWKIRNQLRSSLMEEIRLKLSNDLTRRQENPKIILEILNRLDDNVLTIGFARRFATYKRAHLLFSNIDRLKELVNHPTHPIQIVFAGKAHPNDKAGQDFIKRIIEVSRLPEFQGRIIFVENYDMALAKKLVSGVDVWLNTPTRPMEASGTSGEKAAMNGVINFSVLDGWWAEGYRPEAGWALKEKRTYQNQSFQDELDAETIYNILEEEITPLFYHRSDQNIPHQWIQYIKNTISEVAPHYTMKRMLDEYFDKFYGKLISRSKLLSADNYRVAGRIASWKKKILGGFENIEVISVKTPNSSTRPLSLGEVFQAEIVLDINELSPDDIGIEVVFGVKENDEVNAVALIKEFTLQKIDDKKLTFVCEMPLRTSGVYDYAFRLYPKNDLLPHRQDINLVRWL
ncbi:MAG: alpha-glucan family phosphorylase [Bacteroidetes bacterium]|nr:alpha-glucan family phosphorylase [Bacteroidota bacterium]